MQRQRIDRVIQSELTPMQKETIIAYYFLQETIPEIARRRGVNKSTVCRTLQRAEKRLKQYLAY